MSRSTRFTSPTAFWIDARPLDATDEACVNRPGFSGVAVLVSIVSPRVLSADWS